ncbi:MAG: phosphotransferase, partial [Pseudorhodobacter sp.]
MPGFLKHYTDAGRAREALRRTLALRRHGFPTPAAQEGPDPNTLAFDLIKGRTGRDLIRGTLSPLLKVVSRLHAAKVPDLPTFDPLLRIRPRLALADEPLLRRVAEGAVPNGRALLHGDLHAGQFIQEPSGEVWLLDLDDLAIGPPEADLANFAAHMATTDAGLGVAGWAEQVCRDWA